MGMRQRSVEIVDWEELKFNVSTTAISTFKFRPARPFLLLLAPKLIDAAFLS
jgi:hypothetical protein